MPLSIIFMFPGQGSQYYHMGREYFDTNSCFRNSMIQIDRLVEDATGESAIEIIYNANKKKSDFFKEETMSSIAIFMVEVSITRMLMENNILPSYLIGASLGEFVAATVSKMAKIEDILQILINCMKQFDCNRNQGLMIGILENEAIYHENSVLYMNSEISAINSDLHHVISCEKSNINEILSFLKDRKISYQILPATGAYHSSYIDKFETSVRAVTEGIISMKDPEVPFVSCANSNFIGSGSEFSFWQIIRNPILFKTAIQMLERQNSYLYIDCGPSGILSTFVKYSIGKNSRSKRLAILSPFGGSVRNIKTCNFNQLQNQIHPG